MVAVTSRKKARIEKQAVQIPEDVAMEILKMLPVKSLLRFRCACKTWYSLISNPEFCNKLHQKRAHLLICRRRPSTFSTVTVEGPLLMNEKPLSLPWKPERGSRIKFLGSCNGLVCLYHTSYCRGLILWNPSTRKFRKLPRVQLDFTEPIDWFDEIKDYAGFGYDEPAGDYKFVWMVIELHRPLLQRIKFYVFSLKSKTWSRFHRILPSGIIISRTVHSEHPGVLSNGAIHWIVGYKDPIKAGIRIFAFDLASETYGLLEFPQECGLNGKIVSLSGFLCCLYIRDHMAGGYSIDLWMMEEYDVDSSWRILASLPTTFSIPRAISLYRYHPIHFSSEEGNIVAMAEHQEGCEIMRLQVKEGATVSYETLLNLSEHADTNVFEETFSIP